MKTNDRIHKDILFSTEHSEDYTFVLAEYRTTILFLLRGYLYLHISKKESYLTNQM